MNSVCKVHTASGWPFLNDRIESSAILFHS